MTAQPPILAAAEGLVRQLSDALTQPREGECLCCYVARMLVEFPCDGTHRHAVRYRDAMAPRATALRNRLRSVGACCCDCELFLNGYQLPSERSAYLDDGFEGDHEDADPLAEGAPLPACEGVRRGSVRPCGAWLRIRRNRW